MARRRAIPKDPAPGKNYFVLDANVLVYKALSKKSTARLSGPEGERAMRCIEWLREIGRQLRTGRGRLYIPDIIIAEAFKVLGKWYYKEKRFKTPTEYSQARKRLRRFVTTSHEEMAKATRKVAVHDVPVNRDVIIGVDRFLEVMYKKNLNVQIADLLLLSITKYLIDFYDIPVNRVFIITRDRHLVKLTQSAQDVPRAIDPTEKRYDPKRTFT